MSSTSVNDSIEKILIEPSSLKNGSWISLDSVQNVDLLGSPWLRDVHENIPSFESSEIRVAPVSAVSISENDVNEKIHSVTELDEDIARFESFDSHKLTHDEKPSFYSNEIIKPKVSDSDLRLPVAEEQDHSLNACGKDLCIEKRLTEDLVSATLAFKEVSQNQCELLRAQTDAINRLAAAIEDQNATMNRFHTFVRKNSEEHITREDGQ